MKPNSIQGQLAGLSILVVEDGVDNQRLFRHFLKLAGAESTLAEDGLTALEKALHGDEVDLVLMDIQIPEMDGYEVTRRLRAAGFTKPIVAVTAHSLQNERPLGAQAGITDFLAKPIQLESFIQIIQKHAKPERTNPKPPANPYPGEASAQAGQDSPAYLLSKYHNNQLYRSIIIEFVRTFQERIETMQRLINEMDWEKLAYALHQMKGAASTYGYPQVSEVAAQMEHTAKEARRDGQALETIRQQAEQMYSMGLRMQLGLEGAEHRPV